MERPILYAFSKGDLKRIVISVIDQIRKTELLDNPNSIIQEDDRLTQEQCAKLLGKSVQTIIKWRKEGKLPYYEMGRNYIYSRKELLQLVKRNPKMKKA